MSIMFNADEILEMAEQIERNGAKFYRKAAEGFEDPKTRRILLGLAAMEDQHEKMFASMRAGLKESESGGPDAFDPEGEAGAYLRAMAGGYVFNTSVDPSETLTGGETIGDILRIAIGLEKDSIVFYVGIREMVPARLGAVSIDQIIHEEMRHVTQLSNQLAALTE